MLPVGGPGVGGIGSNSSAVANPIGVGGAGAATGDEHEVQSTASIAVWSRRALTMLFVVVHFGSRIGGILDGLRRFQLTQAPCRSASRRAP